METQKNTILFTLVYQQREVPVQTHRNQYHSLMSLISDYLSVPGFGICSGMGSCGTCVVDIDGVRHLACDLPISDELANTRVELNGMYW
ncbi:hypothetical protein [Spirosoma sp.]|uniref:hypothetical protein n=1 Tax=Spirosoma sp. TaxID=1899569 RepID=UPI003B3ABC14